MIDIHNPNWIANIYLLLTDPDEQGKRKSVNDIILRQEDLQVTGQFKKRAGRGLLIDSATASLDFQEHPSFGEEPQQLPHLPGFQRQDVRCRPLLNRQHP
jgi:hypothetical protein